MTEQAAEPTPSSDIAQAVPETPTDFTVPEAYSEAKWAENIKSNDDLWKQMGDAQGLIGKRPAGVPEADASPEDWDKFYNSTGRPESAEGYEFSDIEGLPENVDLTPHTNKFAEIAHKHGLSQKQADAVRQEWLAHEMTTMGQKNESLDKDFDEITKKHFGETFEADQKSALDMVEKYVPEELRPALASLENNPQALAGIIALAKGAKGEIGEIRQKYGQEDGLSSGNQTAGVSVDDVRRELAQLRVSDAARNFDHPDHRTVSAKIEELSGSVRRMIK